MDEPQAEQLVETLDHCGAPRAAGGADTSQAWYQLRARKRATFAKKIVIPSLIPRALLPYQWGGLWSRRIPPHACFLCASSVAGA